MRLVARWLEAGLAWITFGRHGLAGGQVARARMVEATEDHLVDPSHQAQLQRLP
jgi:hypothetical protein